MNNKNIEIFLEEDNGYKTWIWSPKMTEEEFVNWWSNLTDTDIIKYYFNIRSLPGTIVKCTTNDVSKSYYCHFHDVED